MENIVIKFIVIYKTLEEMIMKAEVHPDYSALSGKISMSEYRSNYGFNFDSKKPIGLVEEYEGIVFFGNEKKLISEGIMEMETLGYQGADFSQFLAFWEENRKKWFQLEGGKCQSPLSYLAEQLLIPGTMSVDKQGTSMPGLSMTRENADQLTKGRTFSPKTVFASLNMASYKNSLTVRTADQHMSGLALLGVKQIH